VEEISKINRRLNGEETGEATDSIDWAAFEALGLLE
jgi:hypothetical protein